jgi:hypothetical protein
MKSNFLILKSIIMKKSIKKMLVVALATTALYTTTTAQTATPALKKLGSINNQPAFELQLNNNEAEVMYVVIKDLAGTVLHKERITEKNAVRTFALGDDAFSVASTLIFDIQSAKSKTTTLFEVKNNYSVVNDVDIVAPAK